MKKETFAIIGLLFISIIWGTSFIYTKNAIDNMPVFAFMSIRFLIGAIIITIIFAKKLKKIDKNTLIGGISIGTAIFIGSSLQTLGLKWTTASNSAFITALFVIIVPFLSSVIFKIKVDRSSFIGAVIAVLGMIFISGGTSFSLNIGDGLSLLCAFGWAFQIMLIYKFSKGSNAIALTVIQLWTITLLSSMFWGGQILLTGYKGFIINADLIMSFFMVAVLGTSVAYTIQTISQKYTTPTKTAIILIFEPVFALLFALFIKDGNGNTETLTIIKLLGCILVLFAIFLSEFKLLNRTYSVMDRKR